MAWLTGFVCLSGGDGMQSDPYTILAAQGVAVVDVSDSTAQARALGWGDGVLVEQVLGEPQLKRSAGRPL